MRRIIKKIAAFSTACAIIMSLGITSSAAEFIDMPDDWTTPALENAIKNGLLYGEKTDEGMKINPDANITRAEMAAIIVRAFGATEKTDLSGYTDVDPNAWYYEELSKAAAMNAFRGDGNLMNPQNNITFQECYTVIAQILQLHYYNFNRILLSNFSDGKEVAPWAALYTAALVQSGYWNGIDGKLLPTEYITRSQFAALMDMAVKTYIDEPGTYSEFPEGNVLVRSEGVILKDAQIKGDIIIGDGVGDAGCIMDNTSAANDLYVRAGGHKNLQMINNSKVEYLLVLVPDVTLYIDETSGARKRGSVLKDGSYIGILQ